MHTVAGVPNTMNKVSGSQALTKQARPCLFDNLGVGAMNVYIYIHHVNNTRRENVGFIHFVHLSDNAAAQ